MSTPNNPDDQGATGTTDAQEAYWAVPNPADQGWLEGVYWTDPNAVIEPVTQPAAPDVLFYQTRQFDSMAPTVSAWQDSSVLDVLTEPTADTQGTATLARAKQALSDSRAEALALGTPDAAVLSGSITQQVRQFDANTNAGRWNGDQSPLNALNAGLLPSADTARADSLARAQATGQAGAPVGVTGSASAAAVKINPVLARMNKQYDPIRNFYDRASNGSL